MIPIFISYGSMLNLFSFVNSDFVLHFVFVSIIQWSRSNDKKKELIVAKMDQTRGSIDLITKEKYDASVEYSIIMSKCYTVRDIS